MSLARGSYLVPVDDVRLHVTVAGRGAGPVLLYLHGGAGHYAGDFQHFAGPLLEQQGQVVYLDQRGCGASPLPSDQRSYSLARLVADLAGLHRKLGGPLWHLVGHSFGGILAAEYARRHPEQVASLFLLSTPVEMAESVSARLQRAMTLLSDREPSTAKQLRQLLDDQTVPLAKRYLQALPMLSKAVGLVFARPEAEEQFGRVLKAQHYVPNIHCAGALLEQGLLEHSLATTLAHVAHPVTGLYGRDDHSLYDHQVRRLVALRPDSRVAVVPDAGHYLYVEQPQAVVDHLQDHLAAVR